MEHPFGAKSKPAVSQPVRDILETLTKCHPRNTDERCASANSVRSMQLTTDDRAAIVARLSEILSGELVEPSGAITQRGFLYSLPFALAAGFLLTIVMESAFPTSPDTRLLAYVVLTGLIGALVWMFLGSIGAVFADIRSRRHNNRVRATCCEVIAKQPDRAALTAVAKAVYDREPMVREAALLSLPEILPLLSKENAPPLDSVESRALASALPHLSIEMAKEVLGHLQQKGATSVLPLVLSFSNGAGLPEPRDSAVRAVEALEARRELESHRDKLLRPSLRPDDTSQLLHVPIADTESDQAVLLRPSGDV